MQIKMLVSIARSDGFMAQIGQVIDLPTDAAKDYIANRMAEPATESDPIPTPLPSETTSDQVGTIDLRDGVNDAEASIAGKTLRKKRGEP